jgi:membrane fusion protein (multidrug efflux system)
MIKKLTSARTVLLALLGLIITLIILMALLRPERKPLPESAEAAVPVTVMTVHPSNSADRVSLPAQVEANVDALLAAEKAGRIIRLEADRGDRVEQGALLLQVDDRIWQANLKQANIAAENARKNHARFKQLQETGAVAKSEYDEIEKAFIQAESMAEEARINIEACRITSPITGIVNDRYVDIGEYIQPGMPAFQVVDTAIVKVVLQIPERDIYAIREGTRMNFGVQPLPERVFTGEVTFVAAQADTRNNAFRTELTVDNRDGALRPGMIARVEFKRGENLNTVSLPMSAVLPSKGDHIVYLVENGQAIRRKVQIEQITRRQALISRGLVSGDRVIIEGNRLLSDGQRVEIMKTETAK